MVGYRDGVWMMLESKISGVLGKQNNIQFGKIETPTYLLGLNELALFIHRILDCARISRSPLIYFVSLFLSLAAWRFTESCSISSFIPWKRNNLQTVTAREERERERERELN
jgi:hypothetical protein